MLDKHHIETIAKETHKASLDSTNSSRNALRKLTRQILNDNSLVGLSAKSKFASDYGLPINKVVDQVHRNVLLDIILSGLTTASKGDHRHIQESMDRVGQAMTDDSKCQRSSRGGVSRGLHVDTPNETLIQSALQGLFDCFWNVEKPDDGWFDIAESLVRCASTILAEQFKTDALEIARKMVINSPVHLDDVEKLVERINTSFDAGNEVTDYDNLGDAHRVVVDELCTDYIKAHGKVEFTPKKDEQETTPTNNDGGVVVDPNLKQGVDALLQQATGGKVKDINVLIKAQGQVSDLEAELEKLRTAAMTPTFQSTGTDTVAEGDLTYEVVMRKASEIFLDPRGKKTKKLDFDIPTLVWKNSNGDVVRHPQCPMPDETYQFRMYMLIKFLSAIKFGHNPWLHGHTGTGKTTFIEQVASRVGFPVERLNLDSSLERADVVGGKEIEVENGAPVTTYVEGILPRAMAKPLWFICDEIDAGRADMLFVLQRALEGKGLTVTEDAGRVVQQHELFRFVATANSRGQGDEFGFYAGVRPMNIAMLDRFTMFIEVPYLDKDDEMRLLAKAYPSMTETERSEFCEFAQKVRSSFMNGEISKTLSPRGLHAMATYYLHFKALMPVTEARLEAAKVAVIDAAPSDNRHTIETMFNTLVG